MNDKKFIALVLAVVADKNANVKKKDYSAGTWPVAYMLPVEYADKTEEELEEALLNIPGVDTAMAQGNQYIINSTGYCLVKDADEASRYIIQLTSEGFYNRIIDINNDSEQGDNITVNLKSLVAYTNYNENVGTAIKALGANTYMANKDTVIVHMILSEVAEYLKGYNNNSIANIQSICEQFIRGKR